MTGDDLRNARFREKLRGYHPGQVDKALAGWAYELDRGLLPNTSQIVGTKFTRVLRGYHPDDVDALLKRLAADVG